jgi:hypothetical protein
MSSRRVREAKPAEKVRAIGAAGVRDKRKQKQKHHKL